MTFVLFWLLGMIPVTFISMVFGIGTMSFDKFLKCLFVGSAFAAFPAFNVSEAEKTLRNM